MEEQVGILWHRLVNRLAGRRFPEAAVELSSIACTAAVLFRAFGGDHGVAVQAGAQTVHGARRSVMQWLAGSEYKADLAWVDHQALRLPPLVDIFPEKYLNRDLYYWLAALCAYDHDPELPWHIRNQIASMRIIRDFPGLAARYYQLVEAEIMRRPVISRLAPDEALLEQAIRDALHTPGSIKTLPISSRPPHPVLLWLRPNASIDDKPGANKPRDQDSQATSQAQSDKKRRTAEYTELPDKKGGMLLFRPETIFSWSEYAKVEHDTKENDDQDLAQAADDLDIISIARDGKNVAKKLRMELDLLPAEGDHKALDEDLMLPEWDYKARVLKPDQCRITKIALPEAEPIELPIHLKRDQQRLKRQFGSLMPARVRLKAQLDGCEIDIDPYIRHVANGGGETSFFLDLRKRERDLSCLLLADLSLSTEAWVGDERSVVDVIRDSLFLFSEALSVTRDHFALYGFNSQRRTDVRLYTLKSFDESYDGTVRSRIQGINPAFYTRMGAAIRHASGILARQKTRERLLLLLTDGKPNDTDHYEGRYGIEDTRKALLTARRQGLRPFCVTIDQEAQEYLPHIFGKNNFIIIRNTSELPSKLPLLYSQITR